MTPTSFNIPTFRFHAPEFDSQFRELVHRLSPSSNLVSQSGNRLTERVFGESLAPAEVVRRICEDVKSRGDDAVRHYSHQFDQSEPDHEFRIPLERITGAAQEVSEEYLATIDRIQRRIHDFQNAILHQSVVFEPTPGVRLEQRYVPIQRIGICVPGGAASYPSTLLMTAIPAKAAGVQEIAIVAPPTERGVHNPHLLAACNQLRLSEVYAVGGAQAVAALAYGTDSIPAVDMIVGPGNLFVALAKKYVYGHVKIDSIAGPSEVVVIVDSKTNAQHAAFDMLAQAEHAPGSSIVIGWDADSLSAIEESVVREAKRLDRAELTIDSLERFGAFVLARDRQHAIELTNRLAPEHLHIACSRAREFSSEIRTAGAIFIGPHAPVALGDYAAGPSHVLPTGGTGRWAQGLSANDFLRSGSVIEFDESALQEIAPDVQTLATVEGLTAHRKSVEIRCSGISSNSTE